MNDVKQAIAAYASRPLQERKQWYTPAAFAYDKVRPRYPAQLIERVIEITGLGSGSSVLEVGCGPGTATTAFAKYHCAMHCLEPNPDFYRLAQENCKSFANVELLNTSFEEWPLELAKFDAVLSASAFHWIPREIGYAKAADALRDGGRLILLWNKELQADFQVHHLLSSAYADIAPGLCRYEHLDEQKNILVQLGQLITDSGHFTNLESEQFLIDVSYSADDYLLLLNTYSPYLSLDATKKANLFAGIRQIIDDELGGVIELSYLSAFHIAEKK